MGGVSVAPATSLGSTHKHVSLIVGAQMRCPRDRQLRNILLYRPLEDKPEFTEETNAIVKCPDCGWIFSPAGISRTDLMDIMQGSK
jgi:hypothetical protein